MTKRNELKAVVAERGQVTIPKLIRDRLGLVPGAVLTFELKGSKIIVTKQIVGDPVSSVYGCLKGATAYTSTDAYINAIRGVAE